MRECPPTDGGVVGTICCAGDGSSGDYAPSQRNSPGTVARRGGVDPDHVREVDTDGTFKALLFFHAADLGNRRWSMARAMGAGGDDAGLLRRLPP
jgi:hypothetical protein